MGEQVDADALKKSLGALDGKLVTNAAPADQNAKTGQKGDNTQNNDQTAQTPKRSALSPADRRSGVVG